MADNFVIEVEVEVSIGPDQVPVQIQVDLSQPEFEAAVLAAAGRFMSLRRKTKSGGRKRYIDSFKTKCLEGGG